MVLASSDMHDLAFYVGSEHLDPFGPVRCYVAVFVVQYTCTLCTQHQRLDHKYSKDARSYSTRHYKQYMENHIASDWTKRD